MLAQFLRPTSNHRDKEAVDGSVCFEINGIRVRGIIHCEGLVVKDYGTQKLELHTDDRHAGVVVFMTTDKSVGVQCAAGHADFLVTAIKGTDLTVNGRAVVKKGDSIQQALANLEPYAAGTATFYSSKSLIYANLQCNCEGRTHSFEVRVKGQNGIVSQVLGQ